MPSSASSRKTVTDEIVKAVTEGLCGDTLAVIRTLRKEDQQDYIDRMHARTRRVLEEALDGNR